MHRDPFAAPAALLSRPLQHPSSVAAARLRIAVLVSDLPPISRSGIGVSVASECQALVQRGCAVHLLTASHQTATVAGVTVEALPRDRFPLRAADWDILHLHSLGMASVALEAAARLELPLVYTAHSVVEDELPEASSWIALQRRVFSAANHVFFLNTIEHRRAVTRDPSLLLRSSVRHHGVPAVIGREDYCERERVIVVAGRLCRNKGTDVAVAALHEVMRNDADVYALIAGEHGDSDCEAAVAGLVAEFPARVTRSGWLERRELMRTLCRARLALCASRYEPFGLLPLEALQCGTPVLAACSDGARESLLGSPGVELVESYEAHSWAKAIERELYEGRLMAILETAQKNCEQARFDPAHQTDLLKHSLLEVLGRYKRSADRKARVFHDVA
jgi:D-inositol-3-phosphate glycosyltransferase